ncbi:hypothetical protein L7F22_033986 [Adiantum nelumboides]|nr:hypothetical protein [Adiantum nelumboides]
MLTADFLPIGSTKSALAPTSLLIVPWRFTFSLMAMVALGLMMTEMPAVTSTTCPENCSTLSPLPYPFGAKPGCGSPGFQLTDCSISMPLWNLTLAGTSHPYYIRSIGANPNHSNPQPGPTPNYGYGDTVVLLLHYTSSPPSLCDFRPTRLGNLTTTNFYAFEDANLTFYQDHYLLLNCTASLSSHPDSGVLSPNSPSCSKYMSYCNFSTSTMCLDYVPDKELQLVALTTAYGCSSLRRYIITDVGAPVSAWVSATQFAWGPALHADRCSSCQSSGGECGYDVQDHSNFQCYCGDGTHAVSCHEGSGRQVNFRQERPHSEMSHAM